MRPTVLKFSLGATAILFLLSCSSSRSVSPPAPQAAVPGSWPDKMQALSQTLSNLMPLVVSTSRFNNPKNFAKIETNTKQLRQLAHTLKTVPAPNNDPTMRVMTGLFDEDISRALASLEHGDREYARQTLSETTSYCIQCHTQTNNGPDFPKLDLSLNTRDLAPLDQAEFFAATRQFDRSLDAYRKALADESLAKTDAFDWEEAARSALGILIRVKNDPKLAGDFLAELRPFPSLPKTTQQALMAWKTSVREWSSEPAITDSSAIAVLARAEALLSKARGTGQAPMDHAQDVLYFRASGLLHELLTKRAEKDDITARALLDAGISAEATRDLNLWTLHESYYEQCIRIRPHAKTAEECYRRLNESVTLGYSGSGGVRVPTDVAKRLKLFRDLAAPLARSSKPTEAKPAALKKRLAEPVTEPAQ